MRFIPDLMLFLLDLVPPDMKPLAMIGVSLVLITLFFLVRFAKDKRWSQGIKKQTWFNLGIGTMVLLCIVPVGLVGCDELKSRISTKDKLVFTGINVDPMPSPDGSLFAVRLGFKVENTAKFPMEFEVQNLDTELGGIYPQKKPYENNIIHVAPGRRAHFHDNLIELHNVFKNGKVMQGTLSTRLKYGHPGHRFREMEFKNRVFIFFDDRGHVQRVQTHDI